MQPFLRKRQVRPLSYDRLPHDDHSGTLDTQMKTKREKVAASTANLFVLVVLTILSLVTRLFRIGIAKSVVWDEAHFGKFAGHYNTRTWYTDLHPPLGKAMLGGFGNFFGWDGKFGFESGQNYPDDVPYVAMRACCAILASFTVPLAYLIGIELHLSQDASIFLAVMALTDIATLVLSRFILLDPLLLFFTSLSLFCLFKFRNLQKTAPFTSDWFIWLAATGASIGACMSVKWVGLFVVIVVGVHTANDLLGMLMPPNQFEPKSYALHWLYRIIFLIILPIYIYILAFQIHFGVLTRSGPGDGKMGSLFQYHLDGTEIQTSPAEVAFGSIVQFRFHGAGGSLLHSHPHYYPNGSKEQQVTLYAFRRDENNKFVFLDAEPGKTNVKDKKIIKNGDIVRLQHMLSEKNLRSLNFPAPTSKIFREVSFGGSESTADTQDLWRVVIIDDLGRRSNGKLRTLNTRFRLQHVESGCFLRSDHLVHLDKTWGFDQQEVACTTFPITFANSRSTLWNIEEQWNDELPHGKKSDFPWSFFGSFMDDNYDKMLGNSMLVPNSLEKNRSPIESEPWEWPTMHASLHIGGHGFNYLVLGHPMIWLGVTAALIVYSVTAAVYVYRYFSGVGSNDWKDPGTSLDDFWFMFKIGILGWIVNFIPYIVMPRVTYIHHYLPALQFGMILLAFIVEHLLTRALGSGSILKRVILWSLIVVDLAIFWFFKDFAFGVQSFSEYQNRKWMSAWKI
ncbi:Dolichyl-phosphate-mannose-protein mannosyltransferase-domain-containing protein [Chytriomyces sp. MP71]|nr:Dolichyl-phosphate-mannose-protein mannosyltransferase-domain-containing protein [Chytriomyces sp. MP71]